MLGRIHADADAGVSTGRSRSIWGERAWSNWNWFPAASSGIADPRQDLHSCNEARVDSPAWHLVQALATLVGPDGHTPAIDGYMDQVRPLNAEEKALIREYSKRQSEELAKKQMGVEHWVHNVDWLESLEMLAGRPTVNIEGLVGGYTGPGGKTILPHRAVAKLDLRLVPNMTAKKRWPC